MEYEEVYDKAVLRRDSLKADLLDAEDEVKALIRIAGKHGIQLKNPESLVDYMSEPPARHPGSLVVLGDESEHGLHDMVDMVLSTWFRGETITKNSVATRLAQMFPNGKIKGPSLSADLWNRARDGELNVVEKGVGNKPNVYQIPLKENGVYKPYAGLGLGPNQENKDLPVNEDGQPAEEGQKS